MAQLGENFDATTVDPTPRFQPVPRDKYPVQIVNSEMKETSDRRGSYLELELEILSGPFAGRKVFDRLNLVNQNPMTVEIAQKALSQICHAVGVLSVSDSEQLHHKAMVADVRVRPARTDQATGKSYDESNEVKGYSSVHQQTATPAKPNAAKPATNDAQTAPWRRGKAS